MRAPSPATASGTDSPKRHAPAPSANVGFAAAALAVAALALAAIWSSPWFVTQDGPAHLYNGYIIERSLHADSPFSDVYRVQWKPLPNWSGHLLAMAMLRVLPPRSAERAIASCTFLAAALAALVLRRSVRGVESLGVIALLAALCSLNFCWHQGFVSFEIGVSVYALTLAVWARGHARPGPAFALELAALLWLGYFCHPVSWGLAIFGLALLSILAPAPGRRALIGWTFAAIALSLPLALAYRGMVKGGGPIEPNWGHIEGLFTLKSWAGQLGWADPISPASKLHIPLAGVERTRWGWAFAPTFWLAGALVLAVVFSLRDREPADRGWGVLGLLLVVSGAFAPDTIGPSHGQYLPQRIVILGLFSLAPWIRLKSPLQARLVGLPLVVACGLQVAHLWDYAGLCRRFGAEFSMAGKVLGGHKRVATLLVGINTPFRANHFLHFDCYFGIEGENVIWSNYEPAHYYFPVQPAPGVSLPDLEQVSIVASGGPGSVSRQGRTPEQLWESLLSEHADQIDTLIMWGESPELEAISARWFDPKPIFQTGKTRVFARKHPPPMATE